MTTLKHLRKFKNIQTLYVIPTEDVALYFQQLIKKGINLLFYWFSGKDLNDYLFSTLFSEETQFIAFYSSEEPHLKGYFLSEFIEKMQQEKEQHYLISEMSTFFKYLR